MKRIIFTIDEQLRKKLKAYAHEKDISLALVIREALAEKFAKTDDQRK